MIELTPLEIRQKKNDFRRVMRGYDPAAVDDFLETVAAHLEVVVRERMRLADEVEKASQLVVEYRERERALTEALVTAQEMREVVRTQSEKEAALIRREAEAEAERIRDEARRRLKAEEQAYEQLRGRRLELIRTYRRFLEREMNELSALEHTLELETRTEPVVAPVAVPWVQEVPAPTPEGPGSVADDSIEAANESATPDAEGYSATPPEAFAAAEPEVPATTAAEPDAVAAVPVPDLDAALRAAFSATAESAGPEEPIPATEPEVELVVEADDAVAGGADTPEVSGPVEREDGVGSRDETTRGRPRQPDWLEALLREEG